MDATVTLASLERSEEDQIDDEHTIQAVPAKHSGRKEAEEMILAHVRMATEREAAIMQLNSIIRESNSIKTDINDGIAPSSQLVSCLLYTSPSPRDMRRSRMPSSA